MKQGIWRLITGVVVTASCIVPLLCSASQADAEPLRLQNQALRVALAPHEGGFSVKTLMERTTGTQFIQGDATGPLWVIELRDLDSNAVEITNNEYAGPAIEYADDVMGTLLWKHIKVGSEPAALSVRVRVRLDERDPRLSHWGIEVENHSTRFGLWTVHFPLVGGLGKTENTHYVWPLNVGNKVHEPLTRLPMWGPYPASSPSMQFSVVGAAKAALYVATHDPLAYHKESNFEDDGRGSARIRYAHFPAGMGEPGRDYCLPYEVTIGALVGDWIDACKLYRAWALQQKWCGPPLSQRSDVPQWFKDIAVWFQGYPTEKMVELARFLDTPIALHWYNWHQVPFDDDYPHYFPIKPEVPSWANKLRDVGVRLVPYINARLWDVDTESYTARNIEGQYVVRKPFLRLPEGDRVRSYSAHLVSSEPQEKPHIEGYSGSTFGVMCPTTRFWQEKVASICERLVGELKMDGVYFDQTASATPQLCFNPAHGHRIGGGHYWVSGYRQMVHESRRRMKAINPQTILTSESVAEPYSFDGLLTWDATFQAPDLVPMYHYVYSGHVVTFGRSQTGDARALAQQFAQCFIWGTQMGWGTWDPASPGCQYLKTLARMYTDHAKRFTFYGEMLRPARTLNDVPVESAQWMPNNGQPNRRPVSMPLLVHSLWRAPDGALGLVLTNWGDQPQPIDLAVPFRQHMPGAQAVRVVDLTSGDKVAATIEGDTLRFSRNVAPRGAQVMEIQ